MYSFTAAQSLPSLINEDADEHWECVDCVLPLLVDDPDNDGVEDEEVRDLRCAVEGLVNKLVSAEDVLHVSVE